MFCVGKKKEEEEEEGEEELAVLGKNKNPNLRRGGIALPGEPHMRKRSLGESNKESRTKAGQVQDPNQFGVCIFVNALKND